jgi:hypothetical protein
MESSQTWTTSDELFYLQHIGAHGVRPDLANRTDLLKGYKKAFGFRPNSEEYLNFELLRKWLIAMIEETGEEDANGLPQP